MFKSNLLCMGSDFCWFAATPSPLMVEWEMMKKNVFMKVCGGGGGCFPSECTVERMQALQSDSLWHIIAAMHLLTPMHFPQNHLLFTRMLKPVTQLFINHSYLKNMVRTQQQLALCFFITCLLIPTGTITELPLTKCRPSSYLYYTDGCKYNTCVCVCVCQSSLIAQKNHKLSLLCKCCFLVMHWKDAASSVFPTNCASSLTWNVFFYPIENVVVFFY